VDFDETLYGDDIEGDLDSMLLSLVPSTIPQWQTFKLLRWVQPLNWLVDLDEISYGGDDTEVDVDHSKMAVCRSPTNNFWATW
jgi:hypothetical protein